jgi:hypothetical protein
MVWVRYDFYFEMNMINLSVCLVGFRLHVLVAHVAALPEYELVMSANFSVVSMVLFDQSD